MPAIFTVFAWVVAHQSALLMVATALLAFEQWIASTDKLKSNSTLQLIGNIVAGIINVLRIVYKIATGKALVTILDGTKPVVTPAQPAQSTPAQAVQKAIESPATVLSEGEAAAFEHAFEAADKSTQQHLTEP